MSILTDETKAALEKAQAKIEAAREELKSSVENVITTVSKVFFDKYPNIESFGWDQYSPHFNDGDECVFSVHTDSESVYINGETQDNATGFPVDKEKSLGHESAWDISKIRDGYTNYEHWDSNLRATVPRTTVPGRPLTDEEAAALKYLEERAAEIEAPYSDVSEFLSALCIDEDAFLQIWDNHVTVTVNRDGTVDTEECDHD